jgi:hypothetical protein
MGPKVKLDSHKSDAQQRFRLKWSEGLERILTTRPREYLLPNFCREEMMKPSLCGCKIKIYEQKVIFPEPNFLFRPGIVDTMSSKHESNIPIPVQLNTRQLQPTLTHIT